MVNNDAAVSIPSYPYILLNRSILCNCDIEAENSFLLESLAACHDSSSNLVMHFIVTMAFVTYFDSLMDSLDAPILQNWMMQEQILPTSLQSLELNSSLLQAPKTLKDFVN